MKGNEWLCPCCLRVVEGVIAPTQLAQVLRLGGFQLKILNAILDDPLTLTVSKIVSAINADDIDGGCDSAEKAFFVHKYNLNEKLSVVGYKVELTQRGGIYRLVRITTE